MTRRRIATALTVALAIAGTATAVLPAAQAATKPLPASMVLYEGSDESLSVDLGTQGPSDGDERFRHGPVTRTPGGPTIGEYFHMSVTLRTDTVDGLEWREITKEFIVPGGTIHVTGINRDVIGTLPNKGSVVHMVITGGTGAFRGARGEMISTVLQETPWRKKDQFLFVQ